MSRPPTEIWQPNRKPTASPRVAMPGWPATLRRGLGARCPACGVGRIFTGYLTVVPRCTCCGAPLGEVPSDDAPPWVTMLIAGHLVLGLAVALGRGTALGTGALLAIVLPTAVVLCLALLRPVKGGIIGILLKLDVWRDGASGTS